MATLTSADLRTRLQVVPLDYQFARAENAQDHNQVEVVARLAGPAMAARTVTTRLLTWELRGMVEACRKLADGQLAVWQPHFLDSGLHLWLRRSDDRGDRLLAVAVVSTISGPLPVEAASAWQGAILQVPGQALSGIRFSCSAHALAVFAAELQGAMLALPPRTLAATER